MLNNAMQFQNNWEFSLGTLIIGESETLKAGTENAVDGTLNIAFDPDRGDNFGTLWMKFKHGLLVGASVGTQKEGYTPQWNQTKPL